jgi:hypothetical protein
MKIIRKVNQGDSHVWTNAQFVSKSGSQSGWWADCSQSWTRGHCYNANWSQNRFRLPLALKQIK